MQTVISSSVLITGILIVRKIAKNKISRRLLYALWLALPVFLLIEPFLRSNADFPVTNIGKGITYENSTSFADLVVTDGISVYDRTKIISESPDYINKKDKIYGIVKFTRYFVTVLLMIYITVKNILFAVSVYKQRIFIKKDLETGLNIYSVNKNETPFLFFNNIYLNEETPVNDDFMRYMILHEYCHFKQGDMLWNIVKCLICSVYWFNPLIWIALYFAGKDCELACDEAVISIIGNEKRETYGMSLLTLIKKKQPFHDFFMETSMGGQKSFIKERIQTLTTPRSKNKTVSFITVAFILTFTGCILINPYIKKSNPSPSAPASFDIKTINQLAKGSVGLEQKSNYFIPETDNTVNNSYYNSIKKYGDILYFASSDGLYCFDISTWTGTQMLNGRFLLGNISDGYLYFLKCPENTNNPGIGRIDLRTFSEQLLIPWTDNDMLMCNNIYAKKSCIYLENKGQCTAYKIDGNTVTRIKQEDNIFYNAVNQFDLSKENAFHINFGYINSIDSFSRFTLMNHDTHELYICDTDKKNVLKKENCLGNVLICDRGVVYTKLNGDIILCPYENAESETTLFTAKSYGYTVSYGAYNENGIYAFINNDNRIQCRRIFWLGGLNMMPETHDLVIDADSGLSAFNDCTAYFKDDSLVIDKCDYKNIKSAEDLYWLKITPDKQVLALTMSKHAKLCK